MKNITPYLSIIIFFLSCKNNTTTVEEEQTINNQIAITKAQFNDTKMQLGNIKEQSFEVVVNVSGKIDVPPKNKASISTPLGGYVKNTNLLVGDKVRKGQALLTIENLEFITIQQNYAEISKQLHYLKSEYDRQQKMFEENITSKKKFLKAESDYKTALAKSNGLHKQLLLLNFSPKKVLSGEITAISTIYSPIDGIISEVNVVKGTYVSPANEIMHIIDNDHIHVELSVFEKDVMKLKEGQIIRFQLPENSDETYEAEVHLIGAHINKNRTVDVHGHIKDEEKHHFLSGMFVEASIITNTKKVNALPKNAVIEVDNQYYALKLIKEQNNDYLFEKVPVKIGESNSEFVAVKNNNDFSPNNQFLVDGAYNLIKGSDN
jgi:cobalt-zinc-cadmium efflux system membrane fusion protein